MIDTVDKNGDGKISFSEFRCVKKFFNSKYTMNVIQWMLEPVPSKVHTWFWHNIAAVMMLFVMGLIMFNVSRYLQSHDGRLPSAGSGPGEEVDCSRRITFIGRTKMINNEFAGY